MSYKTVIAAINSQYVHASLAPWCLKAGIKKYGDSDIDTIIVEGNINQKDDVLINMLVKHNPDFLGISCYIWNIKTVKDIIKAVRKKLPNTIITLGGPEVSYNHLEVMKDIKEIDFILRGEGERSIAELINCLKNNEDFSNVGGLVYKKDDVILENPIKNVDLEPPTPYTDEFYDRIGTKIAYLETSRGCPFSCSFCLSGRDDNVRFFDIEKAKKDFIDLANSGARTIKLVDRTFNCNKERTYELIDFIIKSEEDGKFPEGTCFHFEVAADLFDEKTINLLKQAKSGLIQMEAGLQSFNEKTLEASNRKTDTKLLSSNLRKLLAPGNVHIHIDLIAGLPYEDLKSFKKSFNKGYSLKPHMLQLGFLKLIHGSRFKEEVEQNQYKYDINPPYEIYESKWLKKEDMLLLHKVENHLDKIYNSGRFAYTLDYIFSNVNLTPFELYEQMAVFGEKNGYKQGIYLEDYMEIIYSFFKSLKNINEDELRDVMVLDRLSTINTGKIPEFLKKKDDRLKTLVRNYRRTGHRTGVAFLDSDFKKYAAVWADYSVKDNVTGRYKLNYITEEEIFKKGKN